MRQSEWRCSCGYALLLQRQPNGAAILFDGDNAVTSCPLCSRDLATVAVEAADHGHALELLERARKGDQLDEDDRGDLAAALGLELPVLDELLEQAADRRQTVLVVRPGVGVHRLNGAPPA